MDRIKRLSFEVLVDHKSKFGEDFADNKKALDLISIIRSKGLKNEVAGYITKFIKNEIREEKTKQARIEAAKSEQQFEEPSELGLGNDVPQEADIVTRDEDADQTVPDIPETTESATTDTDQTVPDIPETTESATTDTDQTVPDIPETVESATADKVMPDTPETATENPSEPVKEPES